MAQTSTSLSAFPEELLDKIFALFSATIITEKRQECTNTLCAISISSKQFHRIVRPHLYRNVSVTFGPTGLKPLLVYHAANVQRLSRSLGAHLSRHVPVTFAPTGLKSLLAYRSAASSSSSTNSDQIAIQDARLSDANDGRISATAQQLSRSLSACPELGSYIKALQINGSLCGPLTPLDPTTMTVFKLGHLQNIFAHARSLEYLDFRGLAMPIESQEILHLVEDMELKQGLNADVPSHLLSCLLRTSTSMGQAFRNLKQLHITVRYDSILQMIPLFRIPSLESLHISHDSSKLGNPLSEYEKDVLRAQWKLIKCRIKHLSITSTYMGNTTLTSTEDDFSRILGTACPDMDSIAIGIDAAKGTRYADAVIDEHLSFAGALLLSGQIHHLDISSVYPGETIFPDQVRYKNVWQGDKVCLETLKADLTYIGRWNYFSHPEKTFRDPGFPSTLQHLTLRHYSAHGDYLKDNDGEVRFRRDWQGAQELIEALVETLPKYVRQLKKLTLELPECPFAHQVRARFRQWEYLWRNVEVCILV